MATFHIHQDSEKENPTHMPHKEKTLVATKKTSALQPSVFGGGAGIGGGAFFKEKQSTRSNFAVLNNNANAAGNGNARADVNSKVAFREVSNLKVNNDNEKIIFTATSSISATTTTTTTAALTAVAKKSTVVPVVEQFKTFSVYEDQADTVVQQQQYTRQHVVATNVENITNEKENVGDTTTLQHQRNTKCDSLHREFGLHDDDYILDTTPMSVSEVLSPMSVDRSMLNNSARQLLDDSNTNKLAEESQRAKDELEQSQLQLPRNDRQRFFEVVEYQRCILEYFRESEKKHRPKPHYMRRQSDINYSMRTILVDWLVEVSEEYNLDTETLYLSVSYIDRFLSHMSVVRSKLQLVGTAAMYIASKYEEIYPPDVGEFVFITDDTYTKAQVLRMEQIILKILAFDLCTPTAYVFINTYAVVNDMPEKLKCLALYISELSLLEADPYLRFNPSLISSASLALARYIMEYPMWSPELADITQYRLEDLKEVVLHLCKTHGGAATLSQQAIQEKYKAEKHKKVSLLKPAELNDELFDEITRKYYEAAAKEEAEASCCTDQQATTTNNENVRRMISLMFN